MTGWSVLDSRSGTGSPRDCLVLHGEGWLLDFLILLHWLLETDLRRPLIR